MYCKKIILALILSILSAINLLSNTISKDGFILEWFVSGPFKKNGKQDDKIELIDINFNHPLKETNAEINKKMSWVKYSSNTEYININKALNCHENSRVAYAFTMVKSPKKQTVFLALGHDDGFKLWVNKKLIGLSRSNKQELMLSCHMGAVKDEYVQPVELKKGINIILLKLSQSIEKWGFYLRFLNAQNLKPEKLLLTCNSPNTAKIINSRAHD